MTDPNVRNSVVIKEAHNEEDLDWNQPVQTPHVTYTAHQIDLSDDAEGQNFGKEDDDANKPEKKHHAIQAPEIWRE